MTVYILIPVHDRVNTTLECLSHVYRQSYPDIKVVVVDDGSTDGTSERVREKYPQADIITGDGDLWWTGAMRLGVEHILPKAKPGDFILSLNDDVTFDDGYLVDLVGASVKNGRAVTASLCRVAGTDRYMLDGGCVDWSRRRDSFFEPPLPRGEDMPEVIRGFDFLFGHGTLIPVEVFHKAGNFNARDLPHYNGDTEFTYRAKKAGFDLITSTRACLYLKVGEGDTGLQHSDGRVISIGRAWRILFSIKSSCQLRNGYKLIDLCCPRELRLRNKLRHTAGCIRFSLGKTAPFVALRALGYLLFKPFPIPRYEFERLHADVDALVRAGLFRAVDFRGKPYYKLDSPPEELDKSCGREVAGLYRSSLGYAKKIEWFYRGLKKPARA